ncbi:MAG: energy transducer TonB [Bacteroidota bacterium]|nr:energy transducer TonB [Bacteroidota bacterium]
MSPNGQKTFTVKASLIIGLAFLFLYNCQKSAVTVNYGSLIPAYHTIHIPASYPGGITAWNNFLKENIRYPKTQLRIEGKVLLNLSIDSSGEVSHVKVVRGLHPLLDAEAKRLVLSSGKWNPATQGGKAVNDSIAFFIYFRNNQISQSNRNSTISHRSLLMPG